MIYLISDVHEDINFPGLEEYLEKATDDDLLIILGDVGLNFQDTEENRKFTEQFLSLEKNIAFIDGNHDNFEYYNSFPEEEWKGGIVGRISENIVHLKRGNVFEFEGKTFFVFGGCKSSPKWKEAGLWHFGEEPDDEQLATAYSSLKKHNLQVDYILTHKYEQTPERGTVSEKLKELTQFIDENVKFNKWFSGHWHKESEIDEKHSVIFEKLYAVDR